MKRHLHTTTLNEFPYPLPTILSSLLLINRFSSILFLNSGNFDWNANSAIVEYILLLLKSVSISSLDVNAEISIKTRAYGPNIEYASIEVTSTFAGESSADHPDLARPGVKQSEIWIRGQSTREYVNCISNLFTLDSDVVYNLDTRLVHTTVYD